MTTAQKIERARRAEEQEYRAAYARLVERLNAGEISDREFLDTRAAIRPEWMGEVHYE